MSPERWKQIEEMFQMTLDLAREQRTNYLERVCADDAEMRREVEAMLTQYDAAGGFSDTPTNEADRLAAHLRDDPMIGKVISAYRIERELGRGGMGAVYLATRADKAFQRRVAIKVIKRGMDTDQVLQRFRHERRILAALDHPNIARLLDGGATESGQPYFVMEYIEGQPLYAHCDAHRLTVRERLRLFCEIASAVEHAHQKQIIHRDIKPSNILVTATGAPKLFDFGIAKLLDPELAADTSPITATAMQLMTIEYASPEQVQGARVSFRSDVYSLGVLLYEFLTGHRPYHFRNRLLHEMARIIVEERPELPSAVLQQQDHLASVYQAPHPIAVEVICGLRGETPEGLRLQLAGSLDRVVLKALRKEASERYASAAELREDLLRYLDGRPVLATMMPVRQRDTTLPIVSPAAPTADSIAVLPFKLLQQPTPSDTDDRYLGIGLTDALITHLSRVRSLIVRPTSSVLRYDKSGDPFAAGSELGVAFILDGSIRRIGERVRVTVQLLTVADHSTHWAQTFDEKSADVLELEDAISQRVVTSLLPQLTGAERERFSKRGTKVPEAFEAYLRGRYYWYQLTEEGFAKAIVYYHQAIALDADYAAVYAAIAEYHSWLAIFSILPPAECLAAAREAARRAVEIDDTLAEAHTAMGFALLTHESQWQAALMHYQRAIELNPHYAVAHIWYGDRLTMAGRFDEAMAEMRRAQELDPFNSFRCYLRQWDLYQARRYEESIRQGYELMNSDPQYGQAHFGLSWALRRVGRYEEAITAARRAIELGGDIPLQKAALGQAYAEAGQADAARRLLAELNELSGVRYISRYHRALIHLNLGEQETALTLLEQSVADSDPWTVWLGVEPQFDQLRSDGRFFALLQRTHNPAATRAGFDRFPMNTTSQEPKREAEKSIAVLPFKLLNLLDEADTDARYLGIGLTDAVITRLSKVRSLIVRPTSSILRYDETTDPFTAGSELGVAFILDGSIRRIGERVRVTVQLLTVADHSTHWAQTFDEKSADVLELEDLISEKVASSLAPHLTGEEQKQLKKRGTNNPEAYEAYLRGRYHWSSFTPENFAKAILFYQRAIELDPAYALAYAGIADYYIFLGIQGVMPTSKSSAAAKEAAQKALALDGTLAEACTSLGFAIHSHDFDWRTAEVWHGRALNLNPHLATAHNWYSFLLMARGRFDEARIEVHRARELDPYSLVALHSQAWLDYHSRRFDDAVAVHREMLATEPHYAWGRFTFSWALRRTGQYEEAILEAQKAFALAGEMPYFLSPLGAALAEAGRHDEARQALARLSEMAQTHAVSPYMFALIHQYLGETEAALTRLEETVAQPDAWAIWLGVDPQLDALRAQPRFSELLVKMDG